MILNIVVSSTAPILLLSIIPIHLVVIRISKYNSGLTLLILVLVILRTLPPAISTSNFFYRNSNYMYRNLNSGLSIHSILIPYRLSIPSSSFRITITRRRRSSRYRVPISSLFSSSSSMFQQGLPNDDNNDTPKITLGSNRNPNLYHLQQEYDDSMYEIPHVQYIPSSSSTSIQIRFFFLSSSRNVSKKNTKKQILKDAVSTSTHALLQQQQQQEEEDAKSSLFTHSVSATDTTTNSMMPRLYNREDELSIPTTVHHPTTITNSSSSTNTSMAHEFLSNLSKQQSVSRHNISSYIQSNSLYNNNHKNHSSSTTTTCTSFLESNPTQDEKDPVILHVDPSIIVCNKPSGLLCVPGLYHRELNLLQYVYNKIGLSSSSSSSSSLLLSTTTSMEEEESLHDKVEVLEEINNDEDDKSYSIKNNNNNIMTMENMVVHRLDMDTSGLVVFARNREALLHLHAAFRTTSSTSTTTTNTRSTHDFVDDNHSSGSVKVRKGLTRKERRKRKRDRQLCFLQQQQQQQQNTSSTTSLSTIHSSSLHNYRPTEEEEESHEQSHVGQEQERDMVDKGEEEEKDQESKTITKTYEALLCGHFLKDLYDNHVQSTTLLSPSTISSSSSTTTSMPLPQGEIDFPLQRDYRYPPFMRVATPNSEEKAKVVAEQLIHIGWKKKIKKNSKPSKTLFRIVGWEYYQQDKSLPVTRIELTPLTGRTHQLRVHCASIGYPIVGDPAYGIAGEAGMYGGLDCIETTDHVYVCHPVDETSQQVQALLLVPSMEVQSLIREKVEEVGQVMCLHARDLTLTHPTTGEVMAFTAPPTF